MAKTFHPNLPTFDTDVLYPCNFATLRDADVGVSPVGGGGAGGGGGVGGGCGEAVGGGGGGGGGGDPLQKNFVARRNNLPLLRTALTK